MNGFHDRIRRPRPEPPSRGRRWLEAGHIRNVEQTWDASGLPSSGRPVCSCGFRGAPEPSLDAALRTLARHWRLVQEAVTLDIDSAEAS